MTPEQQRALVRARARLRLQERQQQAEPQQPQRSSAQNRELSQRAADRQLGRASVPFGLGYLTQPITNMLTDPARRQALGRSAQGFANDVRQIPSLNAGRLASDTANSVQEGVRNLPQTAGNIVQNIPQIARAMSYGPFVDEERAQRDLDVARMAGNQQAMRQAAEAANARTAEAGVNVAAPAAFARAMSVPRAAAGAAALSAPFALARNSDQPLQERLPGALTEMGGAAAFGGGAQALANAGPVLSRLIPSRGAQMVQRMDRAGASVDATGAPQTPRGVTPSLASANSSDRAFALTTNAVADNMLAGLPSRRRLQQSSQQVRDATFDIRDAYGRAQSTEGAGRRVQEGLESFAGRTGATSPAGVDPLRLSTREMGFGTKSELVFDEALRPVQLNPGRLTNTTRELAGLAARADAPEVRTFRPDSVVTDFARRVQRLERRAQNGGNPPTLRDIRELRRKIREAQGNGRNLGPESVDYAALQRLEGALSRDMYEAAGPAAARLQQADQFYRRGMERIEAVRRLVDPANPSATMQQIIRAANPRTLNTRFLVGVRGLLPDDQWRTISASIIEELGRPLPGAKGFVAEQGFSVDRFATGYRAIDPRAARILFGSRGGQGGRSAATMRQLADDLDNLARVADAQKGVAAGVNNSGSFGHAQNLISAAALVNPAAWTSALLAVIGGVITGEMLTNPAFVRFLVSAPSRSGVSGGIRGSLGRLRDIAARDPAILPAVAALEAQLQAEQSQSGPGAVGGQERRLPAAEPAYQ